MAKRRVLTSDVSRRTARRTRNRHWQVLEKIAEHDPLWICWWDKAGRHSERSLEGRWVATHPPDVEVFGLIDGMEFLDWMKVHPDWLEIGEWSDERYATPVRITDAGRAALTDRDKYDMEPVLGGLVEPGFEVVPAPMEAIG